MSSTGLAHRYLQQIALDLIATPEENYLQEFVRAAGEAFEADMVLVSRVRDVECPVNAYAIYDASGQATEYSYPLRGTPCEQVFNENRPFVNLGELQACFPKDTDLQDFGLNAYVGMPLRDRHGECFGLIAALWRKPPSDPDAVLSVFQRVEPRLVAGVDLIERNTSERHALNAQLEILSKRLEVAVETAGLGVWDYDMETGELIWDRRMRAIYGLADDDSPMSYERWLAMLHPEDRPATDAAARRAMDGDREYAAKFRICHPDGTVRWIRAVGRMIKPAGEGARLIGCNWDITEDFELNGELDLRRREAESANRAKSQFLANMSHEIRTPLNGVLGMAQLMSRTDLSERQQRYVDGIETSGRTLLELIDSVLDISRIEAGTIKADDSDFQLQQVVDSTIASVQENARAKGLNLKSSIAPNVPATVCGDSRRLHQILLNLVGNAIKFTDNGYVELSVTMLETGGFRFEVTDTGIGIDPDFADTLFERFSQADTSDKRMHGGAGLGLAICKELAELLGGEIGFTSQLGRGSVFWLEIPLQISDGLDVPKPDQRASSARAMKRTTSQTILVVEDVQQNRDILVDALLAEGYEVRVAENGQIALDVWTSERVDAVLLDLQMPVMSGEEVISAIRSSKRDDRDVPIFAVTADATRETRQRIEALGADEYFSKPLDLSEIVDSLGSKLELAAR